jgi:hypothetical protein
MQQGRSEPKPPRIGLLAAWGRYPVVVAEALQRAGYETYCLGLQAHADRAALEPLCREYKTVGIGRLNAAVRFFRRHGVTQATMAGKFHKKILYQPWVWFRHLPDLATVGHFYPYLAKPGWIGAGRDRKDDTLLGAVVDAFAKRGITFGPATDYAPELLVKFGQLTKRRLTASQRMDIAFGWQIAKEMGRLDVGQSVAVKGQAVLAIEAIEGTDKCIERAGSLCRSGGFTVVKVAKPDQDMRFDVPTVGVGTLQSMVDAKAAVLAIEADKTIVVDQPEVVAFADRHKLVIVAVDEPAALEAAA